MKPSITQHDLLAAIVGQALAVPDRPIARIVVGDCLVGVESARVGLASLVSTIAPDEVRRRPPAELPEAAGSAHALAAMLARDDAQNTDLASYAMAAVNSLLFPPDERLDAMGQEWLLELGRDRNVAVIGHFPFVEEMRDRYANFWVIEKRPQPGDFEAAKARELLPRADMVAITGTTLLNGTLAGILNLCREDAFLILLGPTTPFAPCLFDFGIDLLAGSAVSFPDDAFAGIAEGKCFRHLNGAMHVAWQKPK